MPLPTIDLATLTDAEVATLKDLASREEQRRLRVARAEAEAAAITTTYLTDTGKQSGAAWVQPTGAHNAYPAGWIVTHKGKTQESTVNGNVWEPGVSGWREVTTGAPPQWVQPTGAHDAYPAGAKTTHKGSVWTSTVAANVWEPGVYGWTQT